MEKSIENKKYQYNLTIPPPFYHQSQIGPGQHSSRQYYNHHQYPPPRYPCPYNPPLPAPGGYQYQPPPTSTCSWPRSRPTYQPGQQLPLVRFPWPGPTYCQPPPLPQYQLPSQQCNNYPSYNLPIFPPLPPEIPVSHQSTEAAPSLAQQSANICTNSGRLSEPKIIEPVSSTVSIDETVQDDVVRVKKATFAPILVGKRRGAGRSLPTGVVKKAKPTEKPDSVKNKDSWSQYLNEVQKHRDRSGEEDRKNRSLVK